MKHIALKLKGEHIQSYNCLFEDAEGREWNYEPKLTGFHPAVVEFSEKVRNSIAVKRELEAQN